MMSDKKRMIYGANGYTGRLVVEEAIKKGLKPILAGRSESVKELADEKGLDSQVFEFHLTMILLNNYLMYLFWPIVPVLFLKRQSP